MTSRADRSPTYVGQDPPAGQLLRWCARLAVDSVAAGDPPLDSMTDDDWADFLRLGLAHAMLPLAGRALAAHAGLLPPLVADDLSRAFEANARRNLRFAGELRAVLAELASAGVQAVPWKGPLLAERAYGDLALRQFFDLDVLVRRADLATALDVLAGLGFVPEKQMTAAQRDTYVRRQGELELIRARDGLWLELHTAIVPTYYGAGTSSDDLWPAVTTVRVGRTAMPALDVVDDIEGLCVHGSKHRWDRLVWQADIALMSRLLVDDDWRRLLSQARAHGTLRMVRIGLMLAIDVCGAEPPRWVERFVSADRTARALAADVARALFVPQPTRFDALVFHARMLERQNDRFLYLLNVAFTPSGADWEAVRLPRLLFPVYALTRPVRLAWKYGRRMLARAAPDT